MKKPGARKPQKKRKRSPMPQEEKSVQAQSNRDTQAPKPESKVPPEIQHQDPPSTEKAQSVNDGDTREKNCTVANGVALPSAIKSQESEKPAIGPDGPSDNKPPSEPTARNGRKQCRKCSCILNGVASIATALSAAGTLVTAVFIYSQLGLMRGQTQAMFDQLNQMKADSNSGSAAMSNQLSIMHEQASAMKAQLDQMRDTVQLEQRAWVGITQIECPPIQVNKPTDFTISMRNTGNTPANAFKVGFVAAVRPPDYNIYELVMGRKENVSDDLLPEKNIPPSCGIDFHQIQSAEGLDENRLSQVMNGTEVIYVFGEVVYEDAFGKRRMTTYCYVVNPSKTDGKWKLRPYKQYNHMY